MPDRREDNEKVATATTTPTATVSTAKRRKTVAENADQRYSPSTTPASTHTSRRTARSTVATALVLVQDDLPPQEQGQSSEAATSALASDKSVDPDPEAGESRHSFKFVDETCGALAASLTMNDTSERAGESLAPSTRAADRTPNADEQSDMSGDLEPVDTGHESKEELRAYGTLTALPSSPRQHASTHAELLPLELWLEIAEYLGPRELGVLARVCSKLERRTRKYLYRAIIKPGTQRISVTAAEALFSTLAKRPELAGIVKVFNGADIVGMHLYSNALSTLVNLEVLILWGSAKDADIANLTFPRLRMLEVRRPAEEFIHRHQHLEALSIGSIGSHRDIGQGDKLRFLRCTEVVATRILNNTRERQLADNALLNVEISSTRAARSFAVAFFAALAASNSLPAMVEIADFNATYLARCIRLGPVAQNSVQRLRILTNKLNESDLDHARDLLTAFVNIHLLEMRNDTRTEVADTWLDEALCNSFRKIARNLTTVVGPSRRTLVYDNSHSKWVEGVAPQHETNPFHVELGIPLVQVNAA